MTFVQIYFVALATIITMMSVLWIISIPMKNASIADLFWGFGFVVTCLIYFLQTDGLEIRKILLLTMVDHLGVAAFDISCMA